MALIHRFGFSKPLSLALAPSIRAGADLAGGKGAALLGLMDAGFDVPGGAVLTTALFDQAMEQDGDRRADLVRQTLTRALSGMDPNASWAVRSSASDEDGQEASFAGQHDTFLSVSGMDDLVASVLACMDSGFGEGAVAYRDRLAAGGRARMAVVIQRMVDPVCAGVLFTRHPVRPDQDRVVVEGVPGLGEALVSGREHPDRLELSPDGRRVLAESPHGTGTCMDCVGDQRFLATARKAEKAFGRPQDMEWAWDGKTLWALQSRPVTALVRPEEVWTRTWGDEFWAEATTPLQYTCLGRWIQEEYLDALVRINGWDFLKDVKPLARIHGHVYFNPEWQFRLLSMLPKTLRNEDMFLWLPPYWKAELAGLPFNRAGFVKSLVKSRLADRRASMLSHPKELDAYIRRVEGLLGPRLSDDLSRLSDPGLWERFLQNDRLGREHFRFIRWGLGTFLFPTKLSVAWITEHWAHLGPGTVEPLLTGRSDNRTLAANRELSRLGARLKKLLEKKGEDLATLDPARLLATCAAGGMARELTDFLARHGHRGFTRELHAPRWMDDPGQILALAVASADAPPRAEAGPDPADEWLAAVGRGPGGWWKRRAASQALSLARAYTQYRENQRYALDYILTDMRHVILEMGARLEARGLLKEADQVFFLFDPEFRGLWDGSLAQPPDTAARKAEFTVQARTLPPDWIINGVEYGRESGGNEPGVLTGTGASPGKATGRARVVRGPGELSRVRPGEILVAPNTDSGWTPVFGVVRGLVVETGGMLSHAAIVAREY
ncbi:MAG: PEP/pyruvate-binding domain-containing protein, partial [Pseudomonadota bacterium]